MSNTWDSCLVTCSSMTTLMQGQFKLLNFLSITKLSQSSAKDLMTSSSSDLLHAAHRVSLVDGRKTNNFVAHNLSHAAILETHVWLHAAQRWLYCKAMMHLDSLSITNLIPYSATDLSQWHRAHDWLHAAPRVSLVADKSRMNSSAHDYHISVYTQNTWDLCMVTFSSMMTLMQGQLMHLHSLSITNLSQSSATDLSQ